MKVKILFQLVKKKKKKKHVVKYTRREKFDKSRKKVSFALDPYAKETLINPVLAVEETFST